jgi:hypothetical protein
VPPPEHRLPKPYGVRAKSWISLTACHPNRMQAKTMKRKRHTEEQIIAILREHEAGVKTADLCRKHAISEASFYNWKAKYGGLELSEMTARSNIYRLAVLGLLSSRVPRGIPRVAAYMALGAALTFVVIFLAVTTAHAQYPWTEADGKDVVFFAWKRVTCKDGVKYTMWQPYNTAEKRWLPFRRITPKPEGKMTVGEVDAFPDIFLDGERCMDDNPKGN